jgi:hypothetical protein
VIRDGAVVVLVLLWLGLMGYAAWLIWFDVRDILAARRLDKS